MKNVCILVPETAVIEAIADPHYMFKAVNQFLTASGKQPLFNVQLVGLTREVMLEGSLYSVHVEKLLDEVNQTDLIFIPALSGDIKTSLELNAAFIPWMIRQYQLGAEFTLYRGIFVGFYWSPGW